MQQAQHALAVATSQQPVPVKRLSRNCRGRVGVGQVGAAEGVEALLLAILVLKTMGGLAMDQAEARFLWGGQTRTVGGRMAAGRS